MTSPIIINNLDKIEAIPENGSIIIFPNNSINEPSRIPKPAGTKIAINPKKLDIAKVPVKYQ